MQFEFNDLEFIANGLRRLPHTLICERLIETIRFTAVAGRLWPYSFLGGNAAAVYAAINENRLDLDLAGVSLAGLMLHNTKVMGKWRAVDLSEATLSECDLRALEAHDIYAVGATISGKSDEWGRVPPHSCAAGSDHPTEWAGRAQLGRCASAGGVRLDRTGCISLRSGPVRSR